MLLKHKVDIETAKADIEGVNSMKVSNLYISQVKRKCGIEVAKNLRVATRRMDCLQGNSTTAATDLELVPSPNLPKMRIAGNRSVQKIKRVQLWRH